MAKKLNQKTRDRILRRVDGGESVTLIAIEEGVATETVYIIRNERDRKGYHFWMKEVRDINRRIKRLPPEYRNRIDR
jgi:hypothetical protein